ncbi:MAG: hypothetical protein COU08_03875 [Candidatus Harrisonbacteria bacterium CG10_big_fil_rev_8_21_14_0_10_42_17]|uniref:NAD-dependent epimerase/dehydratase domain-containing protein n=1 Tax=Candidatus Harrisonbacteria bacterium CG10_big_fil_rev_8_21_14_0_10_42_17 TaxID=1974584 RepID=A0A2M6WHC6_9BACT|nr:MAG: hypothetical protein COU08_03875 [Candidatus Harrisonbacteria bacterium CG10_big_fil_rev_8_21_14_0_10_42_17]
MRTTQKTSSRRTSDKQKLPSVVLITGGAGFIGSSLARTLLDQGITVYVVDNFSTGSRENIRPFLRNKLFHFYTLDITKPKFFNTFSRIPFDTVYHLACPTGVPNIQPMAEEMLLASSFGTLHVLELARMHSTRFLFTSTAEVYGAPEVTPQHEEYTGNVSPIGLRSPYEEGKRFSESLVAMYVRKYGLDAKIVRVFNTYGPRMSLSDKRVIPHFLHSILTGANITIYGTGSQTRTHLYIDDLLRGLLLVMRKGSRGEVYNIGGDKQITVKRLAETMLHLANRKNGVSYVPHFIEDHQHRQPEISKVSKLGWKQTIPLEEGLKRMIEFHGIA